MARVESEVVERARAHLARGRAELEAEASEPEVDPAELPTEGSVPIRPRTHAGRPYPAVGGLERVLLATQVMDEVLEIVAAGAASATACPATVALVALGGYGRRELSLRSDVDVLFLLAEAETPETTAFVEAVLYALWDLQLEVGHAVRTVEDTLRFAETEQTVLSSLLDARLLPGGSGPLALRGATFDRVEKGVDRLVARPDVASALVAAKLNEGVQRRERYGETVYLLEPNVKEGAGGLRDLHGALWVSRVRFKTYGLDRLLRLGVMSPAEHKTAWRAYDFLLRVRFELHRLTRRRQDHLRFELQERIAEILDYSPRGEDDVDKKKHGVERFMRAYYTHARNLRLISRGLIERATKARPVKTTRGHPTRGGFRRFANLITVAGADHFVRDPSAMVRIFEVAQEQGLEVHPHAKHLLSEQRDLLDKEWRRDRRMVEPFLSLLEDPKHDARQLEQMHDVGILKRLIPELGRVMGRWQHSLYHVYTVDIHALKVVDLAKRLRRGELVVAPRLVRMIANLPRPSVLYLGALLHDIGKGWPREDHSERGAKVAQAFGERLEAAGTPGWDAEDTADLVWLVQDHLLMSDISQRRDVSDPELVAQFAETVRSEERLEMLYLLTVVDMMGTSPKVWTSWKASLLDELYVNTRAAVRSHDGQGARRHLDARRARAKDALLSTAEYGREADAVAAKLFVDVAPDRYLLGVSTSRMTRHVRMWRGVRRHGGLATHVIHLRGDGVSKLTVVSADRPGLLARIAGVLAAADLSIVSASVFSIETPTENERTSSDVEATLGPRDFQLVTEDLEGDDGPQPPSRIALDVLDVVDARGGLCEDPLRWERVRADLEAHLVEGVAERVLDQRVWGSDGLRPHRPPVKTEVEIAVDQGDEVVFDVFCEDHVGVLWTIAGTFAEHGLAVSLAKISTQGHRVADGFYVRDAKTGDRVEDRARLQVVAAALVTALDEVLSKRLVGA